MTTGIVFNLQAYSLHDGPGIRTVVFLKGCPLRCLWCANPESQRPEPEIYFDKEKCVYDKGCNWCEGTCPVQAIHAGTLSFGRCTNCHACAAVCPAQALAVHGKKLSVEEVLDAVEREQVFYRHGGGGLTLSGGEPLYQEEFAIGLLKEAKARCLHTAIETCGFCGEDVLREAANFLDYILFDIKLTDEKKHIAYTGTSNHRILSNLEMLAREFPHIPKHVRTPVIPSVNDTVKEIVEIRSYLSRFEHCTHELLPYHRSGEKKYVMLGREKPDLPPMLDQGIWEILQKL